MTADSDRTKTLYEELNDAAEAGGYHLNPDLEWTLGLVGGLVTNTDRYGYPACPCRLASGNKDEDLDIVCPCDYRDPDLNDYGACYCALYVSDEVVSGQAEVVPVPERRPEVRPGRRHPVRSEGIGVWRCRVCGYLCAREAPPGVCPICRAKRERFEQFAWPGAGPPD